MWPLLASVLDMASGGRLLGYILYSLLHNSYFSCITVAENIMYMEMSSFLIPSKIDMLLENILLIFPFFHPYHIWLYLFFTIVSYGRYLCHIGVPSFCFYTSCLKESVAFSPPFTIGHTTENVYSGQREWWFLRENYITQI